jgi:type II secretory pathway pseudopilin PulG
MSTGSKTARRGERGVVLLLLLFLAAVMLIASAAAVQRLVIQGRRQKEEELAWRGEQYVRAIRLYYRKFGQFPKNFEDFSKNAANTHFLRQQYKDPMNNADGSWRYIYVGPTGQLMGSLTRTLPIGMVALGGAPGTSGAPGAAPGGVATGQIGSSFGSILSGFGGSGTGTAGAGATNGAPPAQSGGPQISQDSPNSQAPAIDPSTGLPADFGGIAGLAPGSVQPPKKAIQGAQTLDSPVLGGQLVGVGSKVDRRSILFYKGYGKYREWEFIWDPAQEAAAAGGLPGGGLLPPGIAAPPPGGPAIGTQPPGNPPPTQAPQPPQ